MTAATSRALVAPPASTRSSSEVSAISSAVRCCTGARASVTTSASSFFRSPYPRPANRSSSSGTESPENAEWMVSRLVTPGLATGSATTSRPVSVTADLIFLAVTFGSSRRSTQPAGGRLLLIFLSGDWRSRTFAAPAGMCASGRVNVSPNRLLKRVARSRVSSRCWRWSSPTGTRAAW